MEVVRRRDGTVEKIAPDAVVAHLVAIVEKERG